jgi:hypothetical protein
MSALKPLTALACIVVVVSCYADSTEEEDQGVAHNPQLPPGWVDLNINVEEAVVGQFAGFFVLSTQTLCPEQGEILNSQSEHGTIALTFSSFESQPADRPTTLSGLAVVGNQKFPSKIQLIARPRGKDKHRFNVNLTGLTESELVGVATVDSDTITMRLHDNSPHTTVVILRRQSQRPNPTPSIGTDAQDEAGISNVFYPDGQLP